MKEKSNYALFLKKICKDEIKITVVIPCYNVEPYIEQVVDTIPEFVSRVILVNDASRDDTATKLNGLTGNQYEVIHLPNNRGVGGAVLCGFQCAVEKGADIVVKMDGDGQMDPIYLPHLIQPIIDGKADYTKGNRFLHDTELRKMPTIRRLGNLGLSFMAKLASGYWNIFDPTNGYTAISTKIIPMLDKERLSPDYFFETSMLLELGRLRAVVKDISIPAKYNDEKSSLSEWKSLIEFPGKLLIGLFRRIEYLYFLKDFNAVTIFLIGALIGIIFGLAWGIIQWIHGSINGVQASTGTVMIAVLPLILGLQLLMQALVLDIQNIPTDPINTNN